MCRYRKIDLEQWARKEHYLYLKSIICIIQTV